jgi:ElaB/YqjD/DUF883 family membrane-anchored ribosome-binding protein
MKDTLDGYSLGEQIKTDQDAADQEMIREAIGHINKSFETAREDVSDTLKRGENLLKRARNATEGYVDDTTHEVRHRPLSAVALAFAGGAIAGGLLAIAWTRAKKLPEITSVDERVQKRRP